MADAPRVAALTSDPDLRAALVRLAALAGAEIDVVTGSSGLRAVWRSADVVVVGADLAPAVAAADPGRRGRVAIVTGGPVDERLWRTTVQLGADGLYVVPADEPALVELMAAALEPPVGAATVIAVAGGSGGVGASTLAAALALTSAQQQPTVLVDGDHLGGGVDVLLGLEQQAGLRWPDVADSHGRISGTSLASRLISVAGCRVLSWDRSGAEPLSAGTTAAVLDALTRAFRVVVIDLPRSPDAAAAALASAADRTIVISAATVRGVAATASVVGRVGASGGPPELLVRDPGGGRLSVAEIARVLGLPVIAAIQSESAVAAAADHGELPPTRGRGSLAKACRAALAPVIPSVAA